MSDDSSLRQVFAYAQQEPVASGEFWVQPAVFATIVEHRSNLHPKNSVDSADLVVYANGPLTLAQDKKTLTGEFRRWRNIHNPGHPPLFGGPGVPEDAFADDSEESTVAITVTSSGQVTYQQRLGGKPVGGMPPIAMKAVYQDGLFVERAKQSVRSLSFTFGNVPA